MYIPKRYGEARRDACPFCKRQAITVSDEGIPVCIDHKNEKLPDVKCACGGFLDLKKGKFGAFYNCIKCGNLSISKVLEFNDVSKNITNKEESQKRSFPVVVEKKNPREIVVRADDPLYFS